MTRMALSSEFGTHRVNPEDIFPELEWASHGSLGKELVQIFKDLTVPESWVAIHDKGNLAARHESIRGDWKEDPACKIVLAAGVNDNLLLISRFYFLGMFTKEEWETQTKDALTRHKEAQKERPEVVADGRMPDRDPIIGVELVTGLRRWGSDMGFKLMWGNSHFYLLLRQIKDRLVAAGYREV